MLELCAINLTLRNELCKLRLFKLFRLNSTPTICADLIAVNVGKDVSLVTTTIDVELIKVANKGVISARLRSVVRIEIDPLLLYRLKLCQIVEVDSTFASVAAEEENTVLERKAMGTTAWSRLMLLLIVVPLRTAQANNLLPIVRERIK